MPVLRLASDERFVHLDNAHELAEIFVLQARTDSVAHIPSGFIRAETHDTLHLESGDALFTGQYHVNDAKPVAQRLVRVLENRPGNNREPIAIRRALLALPMPLARFEVINTGVATTRTINPLGPTAGFQIRLTGIVIDEQSLQLADGHLVDGFNFGHDNLPLGGRILPC